MRPKRKLPLEQISHLMLGDPGPNLRPGQSADAPPLLGHEIFGDGRPVELEVGFGKGLYLLTASGERPEVNYLGVEVVRKLQLFAATRLTRAGRTNVRVLWSDARRLLKTRVPESSLEAVHVYFPDPWWKKKHRRRRIFTPEFAISCSRATRPGGKLHFASDVEDYFRIAYDVVARMAEYRELPPESAGDDGLTHFERKFRREGRPIFRTAWERLDALVSEPFELPEDVLADEFIDPRDLGYGRPAEPPAEPEA